MQGQKRKFRNTVIAIIVLVAAVCALWVVMLGVYGEEKAGASGANGTEEGLSENAEKDNEADVIAGPELPPFYDEERSERYDAFAALSPYLAFDDVVWKVNVDLDKPPYEDAREAIDPLSMTALVNKYFYLPEDFSPPDLVSIGQSMLRQEAASAMNEMISAAKEEGLRLWVQSGYRSFSVQTRLYNQYSAQDGAERADMYSARPGHSEHQLGLAADLNTITQAFGEAAEGVWTAENCWKYGFIIRYKAENTGITLYDPEPWHVRYVGPEAADVMRNLGILSYEEYWVRHVNPGL